MLYDTLENLNQYTGLFPNLEKAIDFIEDNDVSALPLGRTEIDGDDVYVKVMEAEPTPGEGRAFETHSRYMDLQMDLEGAEPVSYTHLSIRHTNPTVEYLAHILGKNTILLLSVGIHVPSAFPIGSGNHPFPGGL